MAQFEKAAQIKILFSWVLTLNMIMIHDKVKRYTGTFPWQLTVYENEKGSSTLIDVDDWLVGGQLTGELISDTTSIMRRASRRIT